MKNVAICCLVILALAGGYWGLRKANAAICPNTACFNFPPGDSRRDGKCRAPSDPAQCQPAGVAECKGKVGTQLEVHHCDTYSEGPHHGCRGSFEFYNCDNLNGTENCLSWVGYYDPSSVGCSGPSRTFYNSYPGCKTLNR
jgi:hypothetical protein